MTYAQRLRKLADSTGLDAFGDEIRAIADEMDACESGGAKSDAQAGLPLTGEQVIQWAVEIGIAHAEDGKLFNLMNEGKNVMAELIAFATLARAEQPGSPWTENVAVKLEPSRTGRVYIAGPMTGIAEFNFPAFNKEAVRLRAEGLTALNPADHGIVEGAEWADYLRHDIAGLATCQRIHLLPGWEKSKGARLEVTIAQALGMAINLSDGAASPASTSAQAEAEAQQPATRLPEDVVIGHVTLCKGSNISLLIDHAKRLNADVERLEAQQPATGEPVARVDYSERGNIAWLFGPQLPDGTELFKRPAPSVPATPEPVVVQHRKPVIGWKGETIGYTAWMDGKGLDGWPHRELYDHPAPSVPKDDQIAALVNKVRDIARMFHDHQSLRERIAIELVPALKASQEVKSNAERWRYAIADSGNQTMNFIDIFDDWNGDGDFVEVFDAARLADKKGGAQ